MATTSFTKNFTLDNKSKGNFVDYVVSGESKKINNNFKSKRISVANKRNTLRKAFS